MDLASLDTGAPSGAVLHLKHPTTGEPLNDEKSGKPVSITLQSRDSAAFRKAQHAFENSRRDKGSKWTDEDETAGAINLMVAAAVTWDNIWVDEKELPFSRENFRALIDRFPFIREQVSNFMIDRSNFLQSLPSGS